jgi:hypothetical protein
MMARNVSTLLVGLVLSVTSAQAATTTGVIRFTGMVFEPASASMAFSADNQQRSSAHLTRIDSLNKTAGTLHCDALDYFSTYAANDAKVVSVTYQ